MEVGRQSLESVDALPIGVVLAEDPYRAALLPVVYRAILLFHHFRLTSFDY